MAKKSSKAGRAQATAEKQLKAAVRKLETRLAAAEKSAEKWKARAKDHQSRASGTKSELAELRRRLGKAENAVAKWKARTSPSTPAQTTPVPVRPSTVDRSPEPDESWSVTALRREARSRGVAGYSRKTKDQLLDDLRGEAK